MRQATCLVAVLFFVVSPNVRSAEVEPVPQKVEAKDDGKSIAVTIDGQPFATLCHKGYAKPIIYPIFGPGGALMIRHHPMKKGVEGERPDHPHHQSLWYTHGSVNGISFWHLGKNAGTIVCKLAKIVVPEGKTVVGASNSASVYLENDWKKADGSIVLTDHQHIKFVALSNGDRAIDYTVELIASHGDVTFGDTKEGSAGIRTNPALRINRGADARNSEGVKGKGIWGKRAKWVDYSAKIDGKEVGVSIFDHPTNLRHPTWWHARDYGLVAANPFGIHDFERKPGGTGNLVIKKGNSVIFRYRFLFHAGNADKANVEAQWKAWAAAGTAKKDK